MANPVWSISQYRPPPAARPTRPARRPARPTAPTPAPQPYQAGRSFDAAAVAPLKPRRTGDKPASLLGQAWRQVAGVPAGIGHLVVGGVESLATIPRLGYDIYTGEAARRVDEAGGWGGSDIYNPELMTPELEQYIAAKGMPTRTGGFFEFARHYSPLGGGIAESAVTGTGPRLAALAQWGISGGQRGGISGYRQASDEGRIVDVILEDIGNVALAGGAASKIIGSPTRLATARTVAEAEAIEGTYLANAPRSLSSAAADALPTAEGGMRLVPRREMSMTVTEGGEVVQMKAPAQIKATGIAKYVEEWGKARGQIPAGELTTPAAARLGRVGEVVGTAARWGDNLSDAALAWPAKGVGFLARQAKVPEGMARLGAAAGRYAEGRTGPVASIAERLSPQWRQFTQEVRDVEAARGKELTATERRIIQARYTQRQYGVSQSQARAALFGLDQRMTPIVEAYRQSLDHLTEAEADAAIGSAIERGYRNEVDALRPTIDDIKTYVDWRDGRLDDTTSAAMNTIQVQIGEQAQIRTAQAKATGMIGQEQLDQAMLPEEVERVRRESELKRNRAQRKQEAGYRKARRAELESVYNDVFSDLPAPPRPKDYVNLGVEAGKGIEKAAGLRRQHRDAQNRVRQLERLWEKADARGASNNTLERIAAEIERASTKIAKLRAEIMQTERRASATHALSRVDDRMVQEEVPAGVRPEPQALDTDPSAAAVKRAVVAERDVIERDAQEYFDHITGGERMRLPHETDAPALAESGQWDWLDVKLNSRDRSRYGGGGFLPAKYDTKQPKHTWNTPGNREQGMTPELMAQRMSLAMNRELSIDEAVDIYLDAADRVINARSSSQGDAVARVAAELGLPANVIDAAMKGKAGDYRAAIRDEAVSALDDIQQAFAAADPELANPLLAEYKELRARGADDAEIDSYVEEMLNAVGVDPRAVLEPIWGRVPVDDVIDWLVGDEISPAIYKTVIGKRSLTNERITARMQQRVIDLRGELGDVQKSRNRLTALYNEAQRASKTEARQAGRRLDQAADVEQRQRIAAEEADAEARDIQNELKQMKRSPWERSAGTKEVTLQAVPGPPPPGLRPADYIDHLFDSGELIGERVDPAVDREWVVALEHLLEGKRASDLEPGYHSTGGDMSGEKLQRLVNGYRTWLAENRPPPTTRTVRVETAPPSPAERLVARQGALTERAVATATVVNRQNRAVARWNEQVADVETELGRSYLERLETDVNQPAINGIRSRLRTHEAPMGDLKRGIDGEPYVTGVMGRLAYKYGFYDEMTMALEHAVDEAGTDFSPMDARHAFNDALDMAGKTMDPVDFATLERSFNTDMMLHEWDLLEQAGQATRTAANTPFRIIEHMRNNRMDRMLPDDLVSEIEKSWERYLGRRGKFLTNMMDNQNAVMPARYRAVGINARMGVNGLLEEAEAYYAKGDPETAMVLLSIAEDVPTTLQDMVDAGINPQHLIGGDAPTKPGTVGGRGLAKRTPRATQRLTHGLRPLDLAAYGQLEMNEASIIMTNKASEYLTAKFSRRADTVIADELADWHARHPADLIMPDKEIRAALEAKGFTAASGEPGWNRSTRVVPKSVAEAISAQGRTPGLGWRAVHRLNQVFKTFVLPFSPKWHVGNAVGNAFMATVHGGMGPLELAKMLDEIAQMEGGWQALYARGGLPSWAPDEIASHGLSYNEHELKWGDDELRAAIGDDEAAIKRMFDKAVAGSYGLNEFVDNATRSAVYLSGLRKGMTPEVALKSSLRAMGDFTRLTSFERRVMREVFPFYTWLRHQTVAAMQLPLYHPTRAAFLLHLTNMMNDPEYGSDMLAQLGAAIPIGGTYIQAGGLSPFANIGNLPLDPTAPGFFGGVTPTIKVPVRALTGYDIGIRGIRPVSRPSDQKEHDAWGAITVSPLRRALKDPIHGFGELAYQAAGEIGYTRAIRDLVLDASGGTLGDFRYGSGDRGPAKYDKPRSIVSTISQGIGVPFQDEYLDPERMLREQRQREREARRG